MRPGVPAARHGTAHHPSYGPADLHRPFHWGARRTSHQGAAWEHLRRHLQGQQGPCEEEERRHDPGDLFFSLSLSTPFPLTYKKWKGDPCQGDGMWTLTFTHARSTRDLGVLSLSLPCVNPTANLVQEHKRLELDLGTFRPNKYKPSCVSCTPSGPDAQS
jgi:hypothetical protein